MILRLCLLLLLHSSWLQLQAQEKALPKPARTKQEKLYYKDMALSQPTSFEYANYIAIKNADSSGTITQAIYKRNIGCPISIQYYNQQGTPINTWKSFGSNCELSIERDFSKLRYTEAYSTGLIGIKGSFEPGDYTYPSYGSSDRDLSSYIHSNTDYPSDAREANLQGNVMVQLKLDEQGEIVGFWIHKGVHPYLEYCAWEILEKMPAWNPATYQGEPIASYATFPISFKLYTFKD